MKIAQLNKDKRILNLIKHLVNRYGKSNFKIKDYWEADLIAIGFTDISEKFLIYIAINQSGSYYVALESPPKSGNSIYEPTGELNNLNLYEVENLFVKHLKLNVQSA